MGENWWKMVKEAKCLSVCLFVCDFEFIEVLTYLKRNGFGKNLIVNDLIEVVWLERIGLERI